MQQHGEEQKRSAPHAMVAVIYRRSFCRCIAFLSGLNQADLLSQVVFVQRPRFSCVHGLFHACEFYHYKSPHFPHCLISVCAAVFNAFGKVDFGCNNGKAGFFNVLRGPSGIYMSSSSNEAIKGRKPSKTLTGTVIAFHFLFLIVCERISIKEFY